MKSYRQDELKPGQLGHSIFTIGNFDGLHRGHQYILRRLSAEAHETGLPAGVLTFEPHPVQLLYPEKGLKLILPFSERTRLFKKYGVEVLVTASFTREIANTPAREWVAEVLVNLLQVRRLLIGYDFNFGRGRDGDAEHLANLGLLYGFSVEQFPPVEDDGRPISSSRLRRLIAAGEIGLAASLLGRPFHLRGKVIHGSERGRELGYPTANLQVNTELIPHIGVYAAVVVVDGQIFAAAVSIGRNPTFDLSELRVEAHLLDFKGNLYDKEMELHFIYRLRDEMKFDFVAQLVEAMEKDIARTRQCFSERSPKEWLT